MAYPSPNTTRTIVFLHADAFSSYPYILALASGGRSDFVLSDIHKETDLWSSIAGARVLFTGEPSHSNTTSDGGAFRR